jgi:triacylglycerol lipase
VSEDCLTINVVKTRGSGANLPVVVSSWQMLLMFLGSIDEEFQVWIHGGGFVMGGAADPRKNSIDVGTFRESSTDAK